MGFLKAVRRDYSIQKGNAAMNQIHYLHWGLALKEELREERSSLTLRQELEIELGVQQDVIALGQQGGFPAMVARGEAKAAEIEHELHLLDVFESRDFDHSGPDPLGDAQKLLDAITEGSE